MIHGRCIQYTFINKIPKQKKQKKNKENDEKFYINTR